MRLKDHPSQPGRFGYVVLKSARPDQYTLVRDCPFCHEDSRVQVPAQGLWDWEHGAFAQIAFPTLTADKREQVMTGTHGECWDKYMSDPEEENDNE